MVQAGNITTLIGPTSIAVISNVSTKVIKPSNDIPKSSNDNPSVIIEVGVVFGVVVVIISIYIFYKRKRLLRIKGNPISKAYSTSSILPYDKRFEIKREEFILNTKDPTTKIGYGVFGIVYKGILKTFDEHRFKEIGIKTVQGGKDTKNEFLKSLLNEIKVLAYIGYHENIVYFIGACTVNQKKGEVFCIMEYCSNGCLLKYLQNAPFIKQMVEEDPSEEYGYGSQLCFKDEISQALFNLMVNWSMGIASEMEYLCSKNVLHIDLAARNILLSGDLKAKLGDFGLSKILLANMENTSNDTQDDSIPIQWMALEAITETRNGKRYSVKTDVWAFGVTIWEVFTKGCNPYEDLSAQDIFTMLLNGERLRKPLFALVSDEIYETMLKCWDPNPSLRPSFKDLKEFFLKILGNYKHKVIEN